MGSAYQIQCHPNRGQHCEECVNHDYFDDDDGLNKKAQRTVSPQAWSQVTSATPATAPTKQPFQSRNTGYESKKLTNTRSAMAPTARVRAARKFILFPKLKIKQRHLLSPCVEPMQRRSCNACQQKSPPRTGKHGRDYCSRRSLPHQESGNDTWQTR